MASEHHAARWPGSGKRSVQARPSAATPAAEPQPVSEPAVEVAPVAEPVVVEPETAEPALEQEQQNAEPLATDAAKQLAAEHGIDLGTITGTGAEGRITKDDVAALLPDAVD